jgi:hypothetical protein
MAKIKRKFIEGFREKLKKTDPKKSVRKVGKFQAAVYARNLEEAIKEDRERSRFTPEYTPFQKKMMESRRPKKRRTGAKIAASLAGNARTAELYSNKDVINRKKESFWARVKIYNFFAFGDLWRPYRYQKQGYPVLVKISSRGPGWHKYIWKQYHFFASRTETRTWQLYEKYTGVPVCTSETIDGCIREFKQLLDQHAKYMKEDKTAKSFDAQIIAYGDVESLPETSATDAERMLAKKAVEERRNRIIRKIEKEHRIGKLDKLSDPSLTREI